MTVSEQLALSKIIDKALHPIGTKTRTERLTDGEFQVKSALRELRHEIALWLSETQENFDIQVIFDPESFEARNNNNNKQTNP